MKQTRFIPTNDCGLQLREPQEGQQESREIENLTPWSSTRKVYEILEPGCISRELLAKSDVILNLNHSNMVPDVLGRFRNSDKDTLSLELRGDGIDCRCDLPKTNNANDALELMKRGDITGMSFAFEDDWEDSENGVSYEKTNDIEDGKEVWLRHVKKITGLYDVAIVTHPAYEQTNVGLREASEAAIRTTSAKAIPTTRARPTRSAKPARRQSVKPTAVRPMPRRKPAKHRNARPTVARPTLRRQHAKPANWKSRSSISVNSRLCVCAIVPCVCAPNRN